MLGIGSVFFEDLSMLLLTLSFLHAHDSSFKYWNNPSRLVLFYLFINSETIFIMKICLYYLPFYFLMPLRVYVVSIINYCYNILFSLTFYKQALS